MTRQQEYAAIQQRRLAHLAMMAMPIRQVTLARTEFAQAQSTAVHLQTSAMRQASVMEMAPAPMQIRRLAHLVMMAMPALGRTLVRQEYVRAATL